MLEELSQEVRLRIVAQKILEAVANNETKTYDDLKYRRDLSTIKLRTAHFIKV
jgi:hypothetical protein